MSTQSRNILRVLNSYSKLKTKANQIKEDEEKRLRSIYFGITSSITTIFAVALCILGAWFFKAFADSALVIFTLIIGIGIISGGVILFVWALIRMLLQFGINRNWASFISLILFLAGLIVAGIACVMIISK